MRTTRFQRGHDLSLAFFCAWAMLVVLAPCAEAQTAAARPPVLGVAHIGYYVPSLSQAGSYYHDFLGFDVAFRGKDRDGAPMAYYKINDDQYIVLHQSPPKNYGYIHDIAFRTNDIHALRSDLAARGLRVSSIDHDPAGNLCIRATDPFGFEVQFIQYLPDSSTGRGKGQFMPATRLATRIDHIGVMFQSRQKALNFYGGVLGFTPEGKGKVTKLTIGSGPDRFELGFGRRMVAERFHVKNHICLSVPDVPRTVAALDAELLAAKFRTIEQHVLGNGKHVAELYGPFGNRIELMEPPKAAGRNASSRSDQPRERESR
ncbi:MAG: VOC family protein [Terriglobia bacterium]